MASDKLRIFHFDFEELIIEISLKKNKKIFEKFLKESKNM